MLLLDTTLHCLWPSFWKELITQNLVQSDLFLFLKPINLLWDPPTLLQPFEMVSIDSSLRLLPVEHFPWDAAAAALICETLRCQTGSTLDKNNGQSEEKLSPPYKKKEKKSPVTENESCILLLIYSHFELTAVGVTLNVAKINSFKIVLFQDFFLFV